MSPAEVTEQARLIVANAPSLTPEVAANIAAILRHADRHEVAA